MRIRPHHLLCISNYTGKGYSKEFTENMDIISLRLKSGDVFTLCAGADDICSSCPFNTDGICKTEDKVKRYDKAAADALKLIPGENYIYTDISEKINSLTCNSEIFESICSDCEWFDLCGKIILQKNEKRY